MKQVEIRNMTRRPAPRFAYEKAAATVLPGWEISLVFVGPAKAKSLNQSLRGKDYVPNVLSYEAGTKSGEIVICLEVAKKQAPEYDMPFTKFVPYLFIHGLMHLKGRVHGPTMEKEERALLARLSSITRNGTTTHRNRHRHRNPPNKGGGR